MRSRKRVVETVLTRIPAVVAKRLRSAHIAGHAISEFLNANDISAKKASRLRMCDLICSFQQTLAAAAKDAAECDHKTDAKLNAKLADYAGVPEVFLDNSGLLTISADNAGTRPKAEFAIAHAIIELVRVGLVDRVRLCNCDKWFFAKRSDQKCCSARCRHRAYEQTEKYKASRRPYMRRYYQLRKSEKAKSGGKRYDAGANIGSTKRT